MSVPSSVIYILSGVPLNNSYEHSLYFPTKDKQEAYFIGFHREKVFNKFTYLAPEKAIKVAGDVANARRWNYLMFQNDAGKWYYHFITKVEYTNDNAVKLYIELDVLQTFMFDWNMHQCFIERTHTPTDEFGQHTIDEGLEAGELVDRNVFDRMFTDWCILILCAMDEDSKSSYAKMYSGVFSGLAIYAVKTSSYKALGEWLDAKSTAGTIDAVVSMWMYPKDLVSVTDDWSSSAVLHPVQGFTSIDVATVPESIYETVDGYKPKNKKVLCYPYTMLYVTNNMGNSAMFRRERFSSNEEYKFKIMGALSPDSGVQLVPYGYNDRSIAYDYALSIGSFPTCAWDSDTYKVWLAQNQNTQENMITQSKIQAVASMASVAGSVGTLNTMGAVAGLGGLYNAYSNIQGLMAQRKDMEVQPPQARGNHSGNINLANNRCGFSFHFKTVTAEFAVMLDHYFSRYGYKYNRVEIPTLKNRERFTYIKTQGCFVTGELGTEDQLKIQAIFDKGITWWADHDSVGDFISDNPCL